MDKSTIDEIKALRQDIETQTAINIVEGINTAETLAVLGHWMRARRPPTGKEAAAIERLARSRWVQQVRHAIAIAKKDAGGLDQSLGDMLAGLAGAQPKKAKPKRRR